VNKVLKGATILAVCALAAKLIGVLYRIPLTNIVGSQGIGLYQMIFPLYVVLLTISSGGLPVAISKVVADRIARGDEAGARKVLRVSLVSLVSIGAVLGTALFFLSGLIARLQGNELARLGYMAIAPAIVFVAILACFRGYYQGRQNMLPSALSQIIEQVIKLGTGLALAVLLLPRGIEWAVFGALIGVSLSEAMASLVLWLQYVVSRRRGMKKENEKSLVLAANDAEFGEDVAIGNNKVGTDCVKRQVLARFFWNNNKSNITKAFTKKGVCPQSVMDFGVDGVLTGATLCRPKEKKRTVLKEIYRIAIPVTLGSLVLPLTQLIDSIFVINLLTSTGLDTVTATGMFGLLTGPVGTLINMPTVITLALAIALLPKVSECFARQECAGTTVSQSLKFSFIVGLLATLFFAFFAKPVLTLLYSSGLSEAEIAFGARLLTLGAISIVYVSILQIATSVLQGAGKAHIPAINLLIGAGLKVGLTFLLLPRFGVFGAMIASVACFSVVCILDIIAMKKYIKINLGIKEFFIGPLTAGLAFSGIALLLNWLLSGRLHTFAVAGISFAVALTAFIALIILFKSIKLKDLVKSFKKIKKSG